MADMQTDLELPALAPSDSYVILMSVACVSVGYGVDCFSDAVLWNCFVHFLLSGLILGLAEQYRFCRAGGKKVLE